MDQARLLVMALEKAREANLRHTAAALEKLIAVEMGFPAPDSRLRRRSDAHRTQSPTSRTCAAHEGSIDVSR